MSNLTATPGRLLRDQRAVTAVEYAVLLAVLSAVVFLVLMNISPALSSSLATLPSLLP